MAILPYTWFCNRTKIKTIRTHNLRSRVFFLRMTYAVRCMFLLLNKFSFLPFFFCVSEFLLLSQMNSFHVVRRWPFVGGCVHRTREARSQFYCLALLCLIYGNKVCRLFKQLCSSVRHSKEIYSTVDFVATYDRFWRRSEIRSTWKTKNELLAIGY